MDSGVFAYSVAGCLGLLVSAAELISRYKDDPKKAVLSIPAGLYLAVNVLAAVGSLYLIHVFGLSFGVNEAEASRLEVVRVLAAGLGSAVFLRSSLFSVVVGDQTVNIGPAAILTILTLAADRAVDRRRAAVRSTQVSKVMSNVQFAKAAHILPIYCWGAMQNASEQEMAAIKNIVSNLQGDSNSNVPDCVKSYVLGFALLDVLGEATLNEIVQSLGPEVCAVP